MREIKFKAKNKMKRLKAYKYSLDLTEDEKDACIYYLKNYKDLKKV